MRNVTLALGSFALGVLITLLLGFGRPHTSTVLQPVLATQTTFAQIEGAEPVVPDVKLAVFTRGISGPGVIFKLDGLNCTDCEVKDGGIIQYSGGKFNVTNLRRSGRVALTFKGAAWNTVLVLQSFGLIGCPTARPPIDVNPNRTLKTAKLDLQTVKSLSSQ